VLRSRTGFHPDQARAAIDKVLQERTATQRPVHHFSCRFIHVMHLENLLCDIDSNGRKLHLGSSGLPVNTFAYITSWYFDTVGP